MGVEKPKKVILVEKRIKLQKKIQELYDYWFSWVELASRTNIIRQHITQIAKHGEYFSIWLEKVEKYTKLIDEVIISLKK